MGGSMNLRDRIGVDLGGRMKLEDGLEWAAANQFYYVDVCVDNAPNALDSFPAERLRGIRARLEASGLHLGLHTLSGVNVAETSPYLADAADAYLRAYMDLSVRLGAQWIVVHAGFHFTSDVEARMTAGRARLERATEYAEKVGATLLLENMNREPDDAEVHYLAHTVEECRYYFDAIPSPRLGWSFTVNHAHLVAEGIDGFIDAFGLGRCGEVRLADNKGDKEEHLKPGQGNIDFAKLFDAIEGAGYRGHYMNAFGSLDDMKEGREHMIREFESG